MRPSWCPECQQAFLADPLLQAEARHEVAKLGVSAGFALIDDRLSAIYEDHDDAKVVRGAAIGAEQDEVLNRVAFNRDFAEDGIVERHRSFRHFEPDGAALAAGEPFAHFIGG